MYMFFTPAKAAAKVRDNITVDVLPEFITEVPEPFNVHWLLDRVPEALSGPAKEVPESLRR
jgi:hypothetical protein